MLGVHVCQWGEVASQQCGPQRGSRRRARWFRAAERGARGLRAAVGMGFSGEGPRGPAVFCQSPGHVRCGGLVCPGVGLVFTRCGGCLPFGSFSRSPMTYPEKDLVHPQCVS